VLSFAAIVINADGLVNMGSVGLSIFSVLLPGVAGLITYCDRVVLGANNNCVLAQATFM
jgi:hypothetical protein